MQQRAQQVIPFPKTRVDLDSGKNRKQPKASRRPWTTWLMGLLLITSLVLFGIQWVRQEMQLKALVNRCEDLLEQQAQLGASNKLIEEQISRLLNDPRYLEQLAREMGMVKPNDVIYLPGESLP